MTGQVPDQRPLTTGWLWLGTVDEETVTRIKWKMIVVDRCEKKSWHVRICTYIIYIYIVHIRAMYTRAYFLKPILMADVGTKWHRFLELAAMMGFFEVIHRLTWQPWFDGLYRWPLWWTKMSQMFLLNISESLCSYIPSEMAQNAKWWVISLPRNEIVVEVVDLFGPST